MTLIMSVPAFGEANAELPGKNENPIVIPLWEDMAPTFSNGEGADAALYVFPASEPNGMALLMCPGGAYSHLAFSHEGTDLAPFLNHAGITLAVLKYRMPNGNFNVPAEDARRALQILDSRADEWKIDRNKIGIGGASAGGHLASTVATHKLDDMPPLKFQVLFYPVISMKDGITHEGSKRSLLGENPSEELQTLYSNELQVTSDTPPAFIMVSADDDIVPVENSLLYFQNLNDKTGGSSLHIYPTGGHGWGAGQNFPYAALWREELLAWLKTL